MHPVLPTPRNPVHHYTLDDFLDQLQQPLPSTDPSLCCDALYCPYKSPLHRATLRTFELCKHQSWIEWRHEFVVLTVTCNGQDYFIHLNRAWAAPEGWRQYVPSIGWGSYKPSNDEVAVYLPGEEETAARHGTAVVIRANLKDVDLGYGLQFLTALKKAHPQYSLIGVNCWAFSRNFAISLLLENSSGGPSGYIIGHPGIASTNDMLMFLRDGGPWAFVPFLYLNSTDIPMYRRVFRRMDILLEALFRGVTIYRHLRGPSGVQGMVFPPELLGLTFQHWKLVLVASDGEVKDLQTKETYCPDHQPSPHTFGSLGFAYDVSEDRCPRLLSKGGDFLYLLTPPIFHGVGEGVPGIQILAEILPAFGTEDGELCVTTDPSSWLKYGIVRQDCPGGALRVVRRWRIPAGLDPEGIDYTTDLKDLFRQGDMIGLWACGPRTSRKWAVIIKNATIFIGVEKIFKESRASSTKSLASLQHRPAGSQHAVTASLQCNGLSTGLRKRLEFGRPNTFLMTSQRSFNALMEEITWTGIPHVFNTSGIAIDTDVAEGCVTQFCEPGDLLYILTSPIRLAPTNRVLSVTVYTWSLQYSSQDKTGTSSRVSFEVGAISGRQEFSPRYEISRNFHSVEKTEVLKRHRRRMGGSHPFVRSLKDEDKIGLWVRVQDHDSACIVRRSLIVVETGPEASFLGRCMHYIYDEIHDVAVNIEAPHWVRPVGAVVLAVALFGASSRIWKGLR